jgi:hypothetical protein
MTTSYNDIKGYRWVHPSFLSFVCRKLGPVFESWHVTLGELGALRINVKILSSVEDPYVFGSPGSGSINQRYGILLSSSKNSKKKH